MDGAQYCYQGCVVSSFLIPLYWRGWFAIKCPGVLDQCRNWDEKRTPLRLLGCIPNSLSRTLSSLDEMVIFDRFCPSNVDFGTTGYSYLNRWITTLFSTRTLCVKRNNICHAMPWKSISFWVPLLLLSCPRHNYCRIPVGYHSSATWRWQRGRPLLGLELCFYGSIFELETIKWEI